MTSWLIGIWALSISLVFTFCLIAEALGETGDSDALLAPIPVFNDTIQKTFGMTADALYALPME